jgi:hypothetical protein
MAVCDGSCRTALSTQMMFQAAGFFNHRSYRNAVRSAASCGALIELFTVGRSIAEDIWDFGRRFSGHAGVRRSTAAAERGHSFECAVAPGMLAFTVGGIVSGGDKTFGKLFTLFIGRSPALYFQSNADLSGIVFNEVNAGLFKSFLYFDDC